MRFSVLTARPRLTNVVVLSLLSSSLVVAAVRADGYHASNVELNDGAVWVFRDDKGWISKANSQTAEVESAFPIPGAELVQDGDAVLTMSPNGLQRIEVTSGKATNAVTMPAGMQVGVGDGVGYLFNPATGDIWVAPASSLVAWDESIDSALVVSPSSKILAAVDGTVVVVDPETDEVTAVHVDELGVISIDPPRMFGHDVPATEDWTLSAAGATPLVLTGSTLMVEGRSPVDLTGLGEVLALQEIGPSRDSAVVAGAERLVQVEFGGEVTDLYSKGTGEPARPMIVGQCVSAAWSGSPWFAQRCGDAQFEGKVPDVPNGAALRFRANGRALALSGPGTLHFIVRDGVLWPITNWDQADPDQKKQNNEQDQQVIEQDDQLERTCDPTAVPPTGPQDPILFGAHTGQTVVLEILSYFNDANCDPLAITSVTVEGAPAEQVSIINFGQSLQFRAPGEAGDVVIGFVVDDGDQGSSVTGTAVVSVTSDSSREPRLKNDRQARTTVQVGKTVSYNVLVDWVDDDGDVLVLESGVVGQGQGRAISSPDGLVTYTAEDTVPGTKTLDYSLTDGVHLVTGTLEIIVQPEGTQMRPVARDDYAAGQVNQPIKVFPLLNDTDANNDPLIVTPLLDTVSPALQVDASGSDGSLVFTASEPGTYIVRYQVADTSDKIAIAAVRLNVVPAGDENRAPVAVRDSVVIREGRAANVDVLVNDTDADGDLLAVVNARLTAELEASGTVRVVVIERRYVRVEVLRDPEVPIEVTYLINDGRSQNVEGSLVVTVPSAQQNQFPIVADDRAVVRVDEVVSVNVLANDRDPDGDQMLFIPSVDGSSAVQVTSGEGTAWLDGTTVRFKAGSQPTGARPVVVTYQVDDDPLLRGLHRTTGTLLIDVRDDAKNLPPIPQPLALRVFADSRATVKVPLSGIDANGDTSIMRPDLLSQPSELGSAVVVGDTVVFEAGSTPGTGIIEYLVQDRFGLEGIGVIRVVVVEGDPFPPVPLNDKLRVRPARDVQFNVLANDTDPNGDPLTIDPELIVSDVALLADVNSDGQRINLTIPDVTGLTTYTVKYTVDDGRGGRALATLTIEVDPEAPLQAPVLRDDPDVDSPPNVVEVTDAAGSQVKVTDIEVTANDDDPDGSRDALVVQVADGQGTDVGVGLQGILPAAPGWLRVVMRDEPQWVVYTATDGDLNVSSAVMFIDSTANRRPVCPVEPIAVAVAGGEAVNIVIADLVKDPDGDTVRMIGSDVVLTPADGTLVQTEGNFDTFTYQANPVTTLSKVVAKVVVEDRPGDPDSISATCFLNIEIERTNNPPVVTDATFPVEQSENEVPLNLTQYVQDPDGDVLQFRLPQGGSDVSLDAINLTLSSDGSATLVGDKATAGAAPVFSYEVWDGQETSPWQTGKVRVTVVPTSEAPPTVLSKEFADVPQGEPFTWDVSEGSFNPFDEALVYAVEKTAIEGLGGATIDGSIVAFTPAADYFGRAVVRFTAKDELQREAIGTLTFTVIGKPLAPGQPIVSEVSSHRVVMSWAPADPQGTPLTDYIVRWPAGQFRTGGSTSATIDGLQNGLEVAFTVTAVNKLGEGPASAESVPVLPNEVPQKPSAPLIDPNFGNGQLTVQWSPPIVDGTPVIEYLLSISSGGTVTLGAGTLRYTWLGLTNGTPYSFAVVAVNSAGPSERSDFSTQLSPATVPSRTTGLTAADAGSAIECRALLSWTRPADNGRPINGYEIRIDGGTVMSDFATNPATSQNFAVPCGTHTYEVRAINVVGPALEWSAATPPTVSPRAASAPNLASASSNSDGQIPITIGWSADTGGCALTKFQYTTNAGTWADVPGGLKSSGASYTLTATSAGGGLANGTSYTIQLRAVNCKASVQSTGSNTRAATPSGPPISAGISIGGTPSGQTITWTWSTASAYNGSPLSVHVTGAGIDTTAASSGGTAINYGAYNSPQTLNVQVCDAVGRCTTKSLGRTTDGPPPPPGMVVYPWTGTCPEDDMSGPDHFDAGPPATCIAPGGFIPSGRAVTVTCRINTGMVVSGTANRRWLLISAGGPVGWYVSDYTVNEVTDALPTC